jgi:hypothetical protein
MSLTKIAVIIGACVVILIAGVSFYAGMFDKCSMTREPRGPFKLIYREYEGSYEGIRFVMNSVYRYVRDSLKLATTTGFAVFYDNPQTDNPDTLRSISGIITDSLVPVKLPYKTGHFERTDAVVGQFRIRSFFSYATGGYKFYAQLQNFLKEKNIEQTGPVMEMYDMAERSIYFIAPVQRTTSPVPEFIRKK